ncbi:MAG TPA: methylmalonyl Co-A mutase-associated GTPase MeaB [Streptosporangiaceae bacterium]|nr:methylmalonyl Co-A mutase-associated GTPase MeaB [Streptosporangiaceae bacterium]
MPAEAGIPASGPAKAGTVHSRRAPADPEALITAARAGDPRALGRLVSLVENAAPELRRVMKVIAPMAGHARVIGLTGSPGVGKSTVTTALVRRFRDAGMRVGVLAVDPSSPFTGGALLGDRVRMQDHATDDQVFIRSMASRGHLGGLAGATPQALRILDAAGFDVILIETVGVGQAEVEIATLADCSLVVLAPGLGDSIQAAKAGILEIADIFVVNKSDRPGAQEVVRDLRNMLAMASYGQGQWKPPIVTTTASTGDGIPELVDKIDAQGAWLDSSGGRESRRRNRAREEISTVAMAELRQRMGGMPGESRLDELAARVCTGDLDPYAAADELISG